MRYEVVMANVLSQVNLDTSWNELETRYIESKPYK